MIQNLLSYHVAHLCKIGIKFQKFLNSYCYITLSYTLALQDQDPLHKLLVCHLVRFYSR